MSAPLMSAQDIAGRFGLEKYPRSWRGTCPACDYSRVFSVKAGRDQRPVLYCANGCSKSELEDTLQRCFGEQWKPAPAKEGDAENEAETRLRKSKQAVAIFNGSTALLAHDPAGRYLAHRGLPHLLSSAALRYRGDCYHPEGGRHPALVAIVQDAAGQPVACHRTYLTTAGRKASAEPPKASKGPVWTGAVRLDPIAPEIVIGEGIETSASAGILLGLPAWAAISAGNMARGLILPPEVRSIVIAADRDRVGSQAAYQAAHRWRAEGRQVRIAWPDAEGRDFNDILIQRAEAQPHAA